MNDPSIHPFYDHVWSEPGEHCQRRPLNQLHAQTYQWVGWPNASIPAGIITGTCWIPILSLWMKIPVIGYMLHNTCDCGVPVSHAPANEVWTDKSLFGAENNLEIWHIQPLPTSMPTLYTGTYAQNLTQFHTDQIDLATRYQAHHGPAIMDGRLRKVTATLFV